MICGVTACAGNADMGSNPLRGDVPDPGLRLRPPRGHHRHGEGHLRLYGSGPSLQVWFGRGPPSALHRGLLKKVPVICPAQEMMVGGLQHTYVVSFRSNIQPSRPRGVYSIPSKPVLSSCVFTVYRLLCVGVFKKTHING
jgi:hypothetical protein